MDAAFNGYKECAECGAEKYRRHRGDCPQIKRSLRRQIELGRGIDETDPVCPFCLEADEHWTEHQKFARGEDGTEIEIECGCGQSYLAKMAVNVRFNSRPVPQPDN
jgi:hypothetical protein